MKLLSLSSASVDIETATLTSYYRSVRTCIPRQSGISLSVPRTSLIVRQSK